MEEARARASPRPRIPATNVVMFAVTLVTTLWTGFNLSGVEVPSPWGAPVVEAARRLILVALAGAPFAGSLLAILFAHEMGHYLLARRHRVDATLPYFIPFVPWFLGGIGTLGAVIRLRSPTPSRTAALEIGAAGPLFGFVVAVPILLWGYAHSQLVTVGAEPGLQSPLAWALERLGLWAVGPELGNGPVLGESLLTTLALRLTHGPLPAGTDLALHPVGFAAWFGLYVTTINLLPIGQLDGGHVLYGILGPLSGALHLAALLVEPAPSRHHLLVHLAGVVGPHALRAGGPAPARPGGGATAHLARARPRSSLAGGAGPDVRPVSVPGGMTPERALARPASATLDPSMPEESSPPIPAPCEAAAPSEEVAWSLVLSAWNDEAVHRAYLSRFSDLAGMAAAGGRYRTVLAERPGDKMASRMRDEVVKRATILGLSTLPRTQPKSALSLNRKVIVLAAISLGVLAAFAAFRLYALLGNRP